MDSRHIQRCDQCQAAAGAGDQGWSCRPDGRHCHFARPLSDGLYIDGGCSVGPAALSSLQLSYVIFMPFVERPALRGHRWQRQARDNKGGCQLALQDLAVASVQWPQSVRGETIPGLPAGLGGFYHITHPPLPHCLEGIPLWGFGPAFPSQFRALFID